MDRIENFNLFGERQDFPDVVHCETIETRSLVHDWAFKPHRHARLHQFLLIELGDGQALIDGARHKLEAGNLINMPRGFVHGFTFSPGTQGWVVTLTSELMDDSLRDSEGLGAVLQRPGIAKFTKQMKEVTCEIFSEHRKRSFARAHVLRALSGVLAGLAARALADNSAAGTHSGHSLQRSFEALLDQHFQDHLGVSDYASLLAVTPTHLSRVMRQVTGQSALAAIEARLVREARRNLAYSNLNISEIAYQLGFSDPAYFSRVFRRATGQSPRDFRQSLDL